VIEEWGPVEEVLEREEAARNCREVQGIAARSCIDEMLPRL